MSRFLSASNLFATLLSNRRGYSSAAAAIWREGKNAVEENVMMMKGNKANNMETARSASWVPDPVTGYYRPADRVRDLDPAELRKIMLSRKA